MKTKLRRPEIEGFLQDIFEHPEGIERDLRLFRWKHANFPDAGIFSTAHGGDATGNLQKALDGKLRWPDIAWIDGRKVVLEYEQNFNFFVADLKEILEN